MQRSQYKMQRSQYKMHRSQYKMQRDQCKIQRAQCKMIREVQRRKVKLVKPEPELNVLYPGKLVTINVIAFAITFAVYMVG
jgi:hypothetical protein